MLRKTLRYCAIGAGLLLIGALYLVYISESKLALRINQGTSIPSKVEDISIISRLGLGNILALSEGNATATCRTSKQIFREYLQSVEFELIHIPSDTSAQKIFYRSYQTLPQEIINSSLDYTIQLDRQSTNVRIIEVALDPDTQYVSLKYYMDWN